MSLSLFHLFLYLIFGAKYMMNINEQLIKIMMVKNEGTKGKLRSACEVFDVNSMIF